MTHNEMTAIRAHMIDAGYDSAKVDAAIAMTREMDYADADDFLALVTGGILGEPGDRHGVEPGFVAGLVDNVPA